MLEAKPSWQKMLSRLVEKGTHAQTRLRPNGLAVQVLPPDLRLGVGEDPEERPDDLNTMYQAGNDRQTCRRPSLRQVSPICGTHV